MARNLSIYQKIAKLRERFLVAVSGNESLIQLINESEVAEQVYNSNAIENSTLSLDETEKILLKIDLDRFISERELFEAKNLARVVEYIDTKAKEQELDREMILFLHKMLLSNIRDDIAGRFRKEGEWVKVANHIATDPLFIVEQLEEMLLQYNATPEHHIVKRIALLHLTFEGIHPFVDGNGRIGRVINNYLLLREGYVPINIAFVNRKLYYQAFKEFDSKKEAKTMEAIIGRALTNSYHKRLAYLERKEILTLNQYAKNTKQSHSNLINKSHRQTVESFLEKGVWKIGVSRKNP